MQHKDGGFVLLNIFLKHYVLIWAIDASYILGDDFHWVTEGLERKNFMSWEYCPDLISFVPKAANL